MTADLRYFQICLKEEVGQQPNHIGYKEKESELCSYNSVYMLKSRDSSTKKGEQFP